LVIPNYWTVITGEELYRLPWVKQLESSGWEVLLNGVVGGTESHYKAFMLVAMLWPDSIENVLESCDRSSPDPPLVLTTKQIKVGEINMIERSGQQKVSKTFFQERTFIYKQFAYRLLIGSMSPVSERDAEILQNVSFKLEDKQSPTLEKKLQLPEKPQISIPVTQPSGPNLVTVTGTFANIRSGAGNEFPIIATVKQGNKLIVIGESGEWFNVRLENSQEG
jgi:hypothetical protein